MTKIVCNELKTDIVNITFEKFLEYPNHPYQRNTEYRAKKAKHLKKFMDIHANVNLVQFTDSGEDPDTGLTYSAGQRIMLDSHTRRYMWQNEMTDLVPMNIRATIHYVSNMEEAKNLYHTFDSQQAKEGTPELLWGMAKAHGFVGESKVFKDRLQVTTVINAIGHLKKRKGYNQPQLQSSKYEDGLLMILGPLRDVDEIYHECESNRAKPMYNVDTALKTAHVMLVERYIDDHTVTSNCRTRSENCKDFVRRTYFGSVDMNEAIWTGANVVSHEWLHAKSGGKAKFPQFPRPTILKMHPVGMLEIVRWVLYWGDKHCLGETPKNEANNWKMDGDKGYCSKFFEQQDATVLSFAK